MENDKDRRTEKRKIGDAGEDAACEMLRKKGYVIADRNFSCKLGEIDIVAVNEKQGIIAFAEVKTRRNINYGYPFEAVDKSKMKRIINCSELYLKINKQYRKYQPRIDIIEILHTDSGLYGRHLENVLG